MFWINLFVDFWFCIRYGLLSIFGIIVIVVIFKGRMLYIVYVGDLCVVFGWLNKEKKF